MLEKEPISLSAVSSAEMRTTYYPAARLRGWVIFDIFFHSSPFCFQHLQNMMLSLPKEIAFCPPPPSFLWQLLDLESKRSSSTWTYYTGCRKPSAGLHLRLQPIGPFQSNNTLSPNCTPKVIYTTTSPTGKQYVLCQRQSRGADACFQQWDQAFKGPCWCLQAFVIIAANQRRLECINSSGSFQSALLAS